jgi:hypothetical protein
MEEPGSDLKGNSGDDEQRRRDAAKDSGRTSLERKRREAMTVPLRVRCADPQDARSMSQRAKELNIEARFIALFDSALGTRDFRSYEI